MRRLKDEDIVKRYFTEAPPAEVELMIRYVQGVLAGRLGRVVGQAGLEVGRAAPAERSKRQRHVSPSHPVAVQTEPAA